MTASAPAWAVWLALGLWAVAIVVCTIAAMLARRLWRQLQPTLVPLLAMFVQPPIKADSFAGSTAEYVQTSAPTDGEIDA